MARARDRRPKFLTGGAAAGALLALASASAADAASYRIALADAGVYRVTYDDLVRAGARKPLPSATLGLSNQGKPVPIHVRDGGDGVLGKGDWIEFVGEILPGESEVDEEDAGGEVEDEAEGEALPPAHKPGSEAPTGRDRARQKRQKRQERHRGILPL